MTTLTAFVVVVALVALERLAELVVSRRNAAWSFAQGGVETGRGHYRVMVALHSGFLVAMLVEAFVRSPQVPAALAWSMLGLTMAAQALRWWCILTLGPRWNTRIIVVPGLPPVRTGPYRWLAHPNYLAVVVEGVALPLIHGCWITAVTFTVLNALLLRVRVRAENAALATLPDPALPMRDLLVAGGGPIGLATALYAARTGLGVGVREPRAGIIDKACGEGLMPAAVNALRDLGVLLDGHPLAGIRYLDRSWSAEAPFRSGGGLGVRRTVLHAALLNSAAQAGIVPDHRPVRQIVDRGDHLLVDGEPTRYLIAADGLHSPVRRLLGLAGRPGRRRYGLRCHVEVEPWTSFVEVHWAGVGEAYVTPVADHQVGIAVLTVERRPLPDLLGEFPLLAARIGGRVPSKARGAGPLWQRSLHRVAGRVLLVGDAAGYVDAITGEGIAQGLAQARAAVAAVADEQPRRYESEWRQLTRRHHLLTQGLVVATRLPPVRRRIVRAAARLPTIFGAVVEELGGGSGGG